MSAKEKEGKRALLNVTNSISMFIKHRTLISQDSVEYAYQNELDDLLFTLLAIPK
jgi:hypothetical protein